MTTDFESFLCVTEDGYIWWVLKDAIRLGAGYLPVRDKKAMATILRAPNDSVLMNERTLLGAFNDNRLALERTITFERDGHRYVDAEGFLNWLSQYITQTQAVEIVFPTGLATAVKKTLAQAAASKDPVTGRSFESLTLALEGWFDTKMMDLPEAVHKRVEHDFSLIPWDKLSADQRQRYALEWDYKHDPATEQDRHYWWDFFMHLEDLQTQMRQWETVVAPSPSELTIKASRLKELKLEIDRMDLQKRHARGDYFPERKVHDVIKPITAETKYIAYPKAMNILRERWHTTPEELAAWIFLEPEFGGLAAYRNANELDPPPRYFFAYNYDCKDYLSLIMGLWFLQDDIDRFVPAKRYITGEDLIKRWRNLPGSRPEAYINAKIAESRLVDIHPTFGHTKATHNDHQVQFPEVSAGLFSLKDIEDIEREDGIDIVPVPASCASSSLQNKSVNKGGRPKDTLAACIERAYLFFHANGNIDILKPGNIRTFLKSFNELINDESLPRQFENENVSGYLAERIKEVKIPRHGKCSVTTQDRQEGRKINLGQSYSQGAVAKLLTALRKKFPLHS